MTETPLSSAERTISIIMRMVFWAAFVALIGGLTRWATEPADAPANALLTYGLLTLLAIPLLRLASAIATAWRTRDWTTIAAALAVLGILLALTLRDAAGH